VLHHMVDHPLAELTLRPLGMDHWMPTSAAGWTGGFASERTRGTSKGRWW
jgi:hypothetical protein